MAQCLGAVAPKGMQKKLFMGAITYQNLSKKEQTNAAWVPCLILFPLALGLTSPKLECCPLRANGLISVGPTMFREGYLTYLKITS